MIDYGKNSKLLVIIVALLTITFALDVKSAGSSIIPINVTDVTAALTGTPTPIIFHPPLIDPAQFSTFGVTVNAPGSPWTLHDFTVQAVTPSGDPVQTFESFWRTAPGWLVSDRIDVFGQAHFTAASGHDISPKGGFIDGFGLGFLRAVPPPI